MLSAILEGLSIWFAVSVAVGYAIGTLIRYEERLRLESLSRAQAAQASAPNTVLAA